MIAGDPSNAILGVLVRLGFAAARRKMRIIVRTTVAMNSRTSRNIRRNMTTRKTPIRPRPRQGKRRKIILF
jgi:hypothetical protein